MWLDGGFGACATDSCEQGATCSGFIELDKVDVGDGFEQAGDGTCGRLCRLVHLQRKVRARAKIPGLQNGGVTFAFQLPRDPFGPGTISLVIANKEVSSGVLCHGHSCIIVEYST